MVLYFVSDPFEIIIIQYYMPINIMLETSGQKRWSVRGMGISMDFPDWTKAENVILKTSMCWHYVGTMLAWELHTYVTVQFPGIIF